MSKRTTMADLEQVCKVINNLLDRRGSDDRVSVDSDAQGKRAMLNDSRNLSPRLPAGKLYAWLDAFESGLTMGARLGVTPPRAAFAGEDTTTKVSHMQECPVCEEELSTAADQALMHGKQVAVRCPGCGVGLTVDFEEEIAWTITAHLVE